MRTAIFGGTFDPIHNAHLTLIRLARERFGLDRILVVPAAHPPHKRGVTHAPYQRVLNTFTDLGADAILAGHTHGGQVCIPGFGAIVANCDIPLKQAKGLSTWSHAGRSVPLNVSAGCGHSIYAPIRFACRPEATLLTLLPRS